MGLKRTPFQRHPAPGSGTSFAPRTPPMPWTRAPLPAGRKGLPKRSKKMAAYYREVRVPAVRDAVGDGFNPCQARTAVCTGRVEGIHEVLPRGRAGGLKAALRDGPTIDCCHACNSYISEHPRESLALGLLKKGK